MTPEEQTVSEILSLSDDKAKIAMIQLYEKQKNIAFAEWIAENVNSHYADGVRFWIMKYGPKQVVNTEELYTIYLSEQ